MTATMSCSIVAKKRGLKVAHYSFAMANAAENIKFIARYQTDDNNHQGALNVIQAVLDNTSPFNA